MPEDYKQTDEVYPLLVWLAKAGLRLFGWRLVGTPLDIPKYVLIGAPHTSGWDLLVLVAAAFALQTKISWMGKKGLFETPYGWFLKILGGLPIDRSGSHSYVQQVTQKFRDADQLVLVIAPEGTRKKAEFWKSGFYYIALNANVPIAFAFVDYKRKMTGQLMGLMPSGDIEADMKIIRDFYQEMNGKYPEKFGKIQIRP